jgi:hypothetical protein
MSKKAYTATGKVKRIGPENPRQSMEPSELSPDDARELIRDFVTGMSQRGGAMPNESFNHDNHIQRYEKIRAYYSDTYKFLNGISAAMDNWDESGREIEELKERYAGKFVDGVEIGERLAVYEGRNFKFTTGSNNDESNFTFVH